MKYFTFLEFEVSDTAKKLKLNNSIPENVKPRIVELVDNILDPLREAWGSGIKITSGFRSEALNRAVGGSKTSSHSLGWAADLVPANGKLEEFKLFVFKWLNASKVKFDLYINEYSGVKSWIHIGYKNYRHLQRKQFLQYKNGVYKYLKDDYKN